MDDQPDSGMAAPAAMADLSVRSPKRLFSLPASYVGAYAYDASADGERFLVIGSFHKQARQPLTVVVNWPALVHA